VKKAERWGIKKTKRWEVRKSSVASKSGHDLILLFDNNSIGVVFN
jgi:hypothetical protein